MWKKKLVELWEGLITNFVISGSKFREELATPPAIRVWETASGQSSLKKGMYFQTQTFWLLLLQKGVVKINLIYFLHFLRCQMFSCFSTNEMANVSLPLLFINDLQINCKFAFFFQMTIMSLKYVTFSVKQNLSLLLCSDQIWSFLTNVTYF